MGSPLSKYFTGIGAKRLSAVEIEPDTSNQHEFNGINEFRFIFGNDKITFQGKFIYLTDDEGPVIEDEGKLTWYNARENHPTRTEYRFYYSTNMVLSSASIGDIVVIGRTGREEIAVFVAPEGSTSERQLLWLFGLKEVENKFIVKDLTTEKQELGFAGKQIISTLGFEIHESEPNYLGELIKLFGAEFPKTIEFSKHARSTVKYASPVEAPDETLLAWLSQEEKLFKTLEKHIVKKRLEQGFGHSGTDVDEFIKFSLSVQNRRKSRAGYSFEHHLAYIFDNNDIKYSRGQKTERNNKPDFLFPGIKYYRDYVFNTDFLTMLGVKTTAKDRWRQVLSEAERIKQKHLITLEPAISTNQTKEMIAQHIQLVIPQPLMETYTKEQQGNLLSLSDFIKIVRNKQKKCNG